MFRLSARQWLLLVALLVLGVAMQVAWIWWRPAPPRPAHQGVPAPAPAP
jgi:hypothetical protein